MLYTMPTLTVFEVDAIVSFKASFGLPVEKVGQALAECDMGCPFSKLVGSSPIDLRGHPIVCYNGELCTKVYWCSLGPWKCLCKLFMQLSHTLLMAYFPYGTYS